MSGRHYTDSDEKGSSSSSSRSSSPHKERRQRRHRRRKDSKSSSSSSSSSTSSKSNSLSRSKSKSRSRSPQRPLHKDNHLKRKENDSASEVISRKQTKHSDEENKRDYDDSRRSDKAIKTSSNDGNRSTTTSTVCAVALVDVPKAPPPPRISKTAIQFGKPGTVARPGIHMKLNAPKPKAEPAKKITVASAFNNDSDEEVEEMPAECKMRMRNIGRDTPTSSGPNSFGKTKQGFIDSKKLFEKSLREACME